MPEPESWIHLGVNVYCWDLEQQNRLLIECLAPFLDYLKVAGIAQHLFFDRHDVRGPHLMLLFSTAASCKQTLGENLKRRLHEFLAALEPPRLDAEMAWRRHQAIRGRTFADIDGAEDLAPPGSFELYDQPEAGWPFAFTSPLSQPCRGAVWASTNRLARGVLDRLTTTGGKIPPSQAALLFSTFDKALGEPALREAFWRFYCGTFLPDLEKRIAEDPEPVRLIETGIGANREAFDRVWAVRAKEEIWPEVTPWVLTLLDAYRENPKWRLPRELLHTTMKQLMLHPRIEMPLAFFAWRRSWSPSP